MTRPVLVIDNYDSFVYNLVQYAGEVVPAVEVRRNDRVTVEEIRELDPVGIIVSPGPGRPEDAGVTPAVFETLDVPTLGVCLGHQALCQAAGAEVVYAPAVVHGKPSIVEHDGRGLFDGAPQPLQVGRYHSLAVDRVTVPENLEETAWTAAEREVLMAVRHRQRPHVGVQFHPESILTGRPGHADLTVGKRMVRTFCELAQEYEAGPLVPAGAS